MPNLPVDIAFSPADGGKQEATEGTEGPTKQEYPGRGRESGR